jgi:LacI family transcriptional regulator
MLGERPSSILDFIDDHIHLPLVDLSFNNPSVDAVRVLQDNHTIGKLGAEHLMSKGYRRLGYLHLHQRSHTHGERVRGFKVAAKEAGVTCSAINVNARNIRHEIRKKLTELFSDNSKPLGIMALADHMTFPIIEACEALELKVPEQVAFLGVDNHPEICELAPISITSIDNNIFQHGYEGAKMLDGLLDGSSPPTQHTIVPAGGVHERQSTDRMVTRHHHVATILSRIEEHSSDPNLSAKVLAEQVPMSHRRLHDAFIKHVGQSIAITLANRRLNHAKKLIQSTNDKLWQVAQKSGFNSPEVMSRLFTRTFGHSPIHYRRPRTVEN